MYVCMYICIKAVPSCKKRGGVFSTKCGLTLDEGRVKRVKSGGAVFF